MLTFTIVGLLVVAFYFYLTRTFNYWTKRGLKHDKPIPFFGTSLRNFLGRANFTDFITEIYNKYPNERLVGSFRGTRPELIIRDPECTKIITIRDFNFFHRRGVIEPSPNTVLLLQPGFAEDDLWRQLRRCWTAGFTGSKIKATFPILVDRAESLQAKLKTITTSGQPYDAKDLMVGFTNDILGTSLFGIKYDSINNDDDILRQLGIKAFRITVRRVIIQILKNLMRKTFKHLYILGDIESEVIELVKSVMKQRNYEPSGKRDFLDLLLEIKKKGAVTGDSIVHVNGDGTPKKVSIEMTDSIIAAQCFLFFAASDPTSASASYTLHELAHHPHMQKKVQEEIDNVLLRHDKKLSYDAISQMTYLRWCLKEALRLHPFGGLLFRQSVLPYTFPGTNVTIDPGVRVLIPLKAYYNDPKIFPEPQEFRPDRFDPAVMTPEQKAVYLPFGNGPRYCVGERLATIIAMGGLAAVLSKYSVLPTPGAPRRVTLRPLSNLAHVFKHGMPLIFQDRSH